MSPARLKPLSPTFYRRPTLELARALLGKLLVSRNGDGPTGGWVVEVEAYIGEGDPACHAAAGRTDRNRVMYGPPGHAYIYFTYGMHHCFNVVTARTGRPEAILVRALEPALGLDFMRRRRGRVRDLDLARGPARVCQALGLDLAQNGHPLTSRSLFLARGRGKPRILGVSARVGIRRGVDRPWRFYDAESPFVSPGRPGQPGRPG
jgi:DNA-3-methyladenine glycosylase